MSKIIIQNYLPAIVVVCYNRPNALKRLLHSIEMAVYEFDEIPLVISIDGGGGREVQTIAEEFNWVHGRKEIMQHEENIGLRNHVIKCGDLTDKFGSIVMLEDDCFVSPVFYTYAMSAIGFYHSDPNIAGISLYSYAFNENVFLPFFPLKDKFDTYFMQVPSSCGQSWTSGQWLSFKDWYFNSQSDSPELSIPKNVNSWPETSWKKYFYQYMVSKNKYFVYPQNSLSSNLGDSGTHYLRKTSLWHVNLNYHKEDFAFAQFFDSSNKYDAFFEILPECIGMTDDVVMDLFGTKELNLCQGEMVYSIKECNEPIKSFGYDLKPMFLNIIYDIEGDVINFGKRDKFTRTAHEKINRLQANISETSFNTGISQGYEQGYEQGRINGKMFMENSKPYRVGSIILRPLKMFMRLFR